MNLQQFGEVSGTLTIKLVSQAHFRMFNLFSRPIPGRHYRVRRSNGKLELWQLLNIDEATGRLVMGSAVGA